MKMVDLFGQPTYTVPQTEGIKYAGSKLKILPHIIDLVSDLDVKTIFDGFSGSTRVSQAFAKLGYRVISNDISEWSSVFATAYLLNDREPQFYKGLIDHLNSVEGYYGWFSENYGGNPEDSNAKRPFQLKNTMKLDAIRDEIDRLNLSSTERAVALTSLILGLDAVDSTLGHYVAYLSKWSPRSFKDLELKVPALFPRTQEHTVKKGDVFSVLKEVEADVAYFDPPYGSNNEKMPPSRVRYNSYYHIWTSVILNDKPQVFGKANRREDSRDTVSASVFEDYKKNENGQYNAMLAIQDLMANTNARYILLSYSSGGRATKEELFRMINDCGSLIKAKEIDYKTNVMGGMRWTNEWINSETTNKEYLFLMEKK